MLLLKVFLDLWHLLCGGRKSLKRESEKERERRVFTHFEKIKPLQMGGGNK